MPGRLLLPLSPAAGGGAGKVLQAAEKLSQAARVLATQPGALQLRYLQTLKEVAGERSSTIVFPLPLELMEGLLTAGGRRD